MMLLKFPLSRISQGKNKKDCYYPDNVVKQRSLAYRKIRPPFSTTLYFSSIVSFLS